MNDVRSDKLNQLERATDLFLLLKHSNKPLSLREIAQSIRLYADYEHQIYACRKQIDRDKALLHSQGIEIESIRIENDDQVGYRLIDKSPSTFFNQLTKVEREALAKASVMLEVGYIDNPEADVGLDPFKVMRLLSLSQNLVKFHRILREKRRISFKYRGEERLADPGGLIFKNGSWYLAAYDVNKEDTRIFKLDRIEGDATEYDAESALQYSKVKLNEEAQSFSMIEQAKDTEIVKVCLDFSKYLEIEELGLSKFKAEVLDNGKVLLEIPITSRSMFLSWLFNFIDHAEVLEPLEIRESVVEWLEAMAAES